MPDLISRCGFRCDLCPAFNANLAGEDDQIETADAWSKYFGVEVPAEQLRCHGCTRPRPINLVSPPDDCPVRRCTIERQIPNCRDCAERPCDNLLPMINAFPEAIARFRGQIPRDDFNRYLRAFDTTPVFRD